MNPLEEEDDDYWNVDDDDDEWIWDITLAEDSGNAKRSHDDMNDGGEEEEENSPTHDDMVGGGLFSFDIREGRMPQRWRNVVHKTRHSARLQQTRELRGGDSLGEELAQAVRRALVTVLDLHPTLRDSDRIHFTMQSTAFARGVITAFSLPNSGCRR